MSDSLRIKLTSKYQSMVRNTHLGTKEWRPRAHLASTITSLVMEVKFPDNLTFALANTHWEMTLVQREISPQSLKFQRLRVSTIVSF
jgi:hypothetical protein